MRKVLLILALVIATGGILVAALGPALAEGEKLWPIAWILWAPVGYLILAKRPGNGVGAAALLIGLMWGIGFVHAHPQRRRFRRLRRRLARVGRQHLRGAALVGDRMALARLSFRLLPGPGRTRHRAASPLALAIVVSAAFAVDPCSDGGHGLCPAHLQFLPRETPPRSSQVTVGSWWSLVFVLAAVVMLVLRWRRSAGVERLQYRWLFMGSFVFLLIIAAGNLGLIAEDGIAEFLWLLAGAAIPTAIGIAVLRYRLYDIDRFISRTVTYRVGRWCVGGRVLRSRGRHELALADG